ncbi:MAG: hypothetical protein NXH85_14260 [Pseudomonadaceae bacterium]|nr:hypothetical protein [Pseudomonadaceae bacterium]
MHSNVTSSSVDADSERRALKQRLASRANPAATLAVDMFVELAVSGLAPIYVRAASGELSLHDTASHRIDVTYLFDSVDTAVDLLSNGGDVMTAFMEERFRSTGHIAFTYVLLGMFANPSLPAEPPP